MKKNRFLIMTAVAIIMLNIVLFVSPVRKTLVFYVSDIFIIAAAILLLLSRHLAFRDNRNENAPRSRFFGWPILRAGIIGCSIIVIVNIIFIFLQQFSEEYLWIIFAINVVLFGVTGFGMIEADDSRKFAEEHRVHRKRNTEIMKSLRLQSNQMADTCSSSSLQKGLKRMAEEFRYSDPNSSFDTVSIEEELQDELKILETLIETDEDKALKQIDKIEKLLKKRNLMALMGK